MPTDEKLIEWLRKVKSICNEKVICNGCRFDCHGACQVELLTDQLERVNPNQWNMEEIERIIKL